VHTVQYL